MPSGLFDGARNARITAWGGTQTRASVGLNWLGGQGAGRRAHRPQQHDSPRHLVANLHWDACDAASNSPAEDTDDAKIGWRVVSKASRSPAAASSEGEDLNRSSHDAKLTRDDLVGGNSGAPI